MKEVGRQDMGELHRVSRDGGVGQGTACGGDNILQAALGGATKLRRESAE
ncbi:hypothetical protein ACFQY0_11090 [Haloferula chungangensis]|uniref:Uncharacterized protein n=1 Tax=Haloferula chungangensis TaxID=1048331 RepID=A0ABW2L5S8_9BACT